MVCMVVVVVVVVVAFITTLLFVTKRHYRVRYVAPAASQGVLVMGRSGDIAMLRCLNPNITTAFLCCL